MTSAGDKPPHDEDQGRQAGVGNPVWEGGKMGEVKLTPAVPLTPFHEDKSNQDGH